MDLLQMVFSEYYVTRKKRALDGQSRAEIKTETFFASNGSDLTLLYAKNGR